MNGCVVKNCLDSAVWTVYTLYHPMTSLSTAAVWTVYLLHTLSRNDITEQCAQGTHSITQWHHWAVWTVYTLYHPMTSLSSVNSVHTLSPNDVTEQCAQGTHSITQWHHWPVWTVYTLYHPMTSRGAVVSAALSERKVAGSIPMIGVFHTIGPCEKAVLACLATDV